MGREFRCCYLSPSRYKIFNSYYYFDFYYYYYYYYYYYIIIIILIIIIIIIIIYLSSGNPSQSLESTRQSTKSEMQVRNPDPYRCLERKNHSIRYG